MTKKGRKVNIYRFLNSKDISKHLREIRYEFNAMEMSYIVEICENATLNEKINAWQEIIETMPDCPMTCNHRAGMRMSTHDFLREYIELKRRMYDMFKESAGYIYYLRELRYAEWPNCIVRKNGSLWVEEDNMLPFSTFEGCMNYLKARAEEHGDKFNRYVIDKVKIDCAWEQYASYRCARCRSEIVLDAELKPLTVTSDEPCECDGELAGYLRSSFLKFPIPFKRGDIVIDRTDRTPRPFVFDHLKFWNAAEYMEHGWENPPVNNAKKLNEKVTVDNEHKSWNFSHMYAYGYELGTHYDGGSLDNPCDLCFNIFGTNYNYLNLERFDEPIEGELAILDAASQFMKGEIGIDFFLNCTYITNIACYERNLERLCNREYNLEARPLYQGEAL